MSRSSFQHSSLYELLYAWRFLIVIALLVLVGALIAWIIIKPPGGEEVAVSPTAVVSPEVVITAEAGESPSPSPTSTSVPPSPTPEQLPTDTPLPEPTEVESTPTFTATSTPTAQPPPPETPSPTPTATPTVAPTARSYTVLWGDCLWRIAERFYGDGQRWRDLYRANRDIIADPRLIRTGWELEVP